MILTESVRDAGDLWLSLKCPPALFLCDTPCTMTHHVLNRLSENAERYFGDTHGCFEKPLLGKIPNTVSFIFHSNFILGVQSSTSLYRVKRKRIFFVKFAKSLGKKFRIFFILAKLFFKIFFFILLTSNFVLSAFLIFLKIRILVNS